MSTVFYAKIFFILLIIKIMPILFLKHKRFTQKLELHSALQRNSQSLWQLEALPISQMLHSKNTYWSHSCGRSVPTCSYICTGNRSTFPHTGLHSDRDLVNNGAYSQLKCWACWKKIFLKLSTLNHNCSPFKIFFFKWIVIASLFKIFS